MSDSNERTIQSYENHVQEFIDGTPQKVDGSLKALFTTATAGLPKKARILELGSGFGRDADYLQSLGYKVVCTDATQAFVDLLTQKGLPAHKLNALTDDLGGPYDLVVANAVLLHFTREETRRVLQKVFDALRPGGTFLCTLKQGEGESWSTNKLGAPRFFCYWEEDDIRQFLQAAGFTNVDIISNVATKNALWLHIIAKK